MKAALDLAVDALAAYRLTRLVTRDQITQPWRDRIEARSVEVIASPTEAMGDLRDVWPWAFLRGLTDCMWCSGTWCAFGVRLLPRWMRRSLAVAALVGLISERE